MSALTTDYPRTAPPARDQPIPLYRTGTPEPHSTSALAIDPLSELTNSEEAKTLAAALLDIYPHVPTNPVRAGFTFLALAAFGEDPFQTITDLPGRQSLLAHPHTDRPTIPPPASWTSGVSSRPHQRGPAAGAPRPARLRSAHRHAPRSRRAHDREDRQQARPTPT